MSATGNKRLSVCVCFIYSFHFLKQRHFRECGEGQSEFFCRRKRLLPGGLRNGNAYFPALFFGWNLWATS
jgi:hypothetical protein